MKASTLTWKLCQSLRNNYPIKIRTQRFKVLFLSPQLTSFLSVSKVLNSQKKLPENATKSCGRSYNANGSDESYLFFLFVPFGYPKCDHTRIQVFSEEGVGGQAMVWVWKNKMIYWRHPQWETKPSSSSFAILVWKHRVLWFLLLW